MFIYKVYIYLTSINTQRWTTAPFDNTPIISSRNRQTTGLYQGSDNCCEVCCNSDIIILLQQFQTIHYCNQSVLYIVPDLNIFVFSITIFDLILGSALVQFSLIRASYLYNLTGLSFYIFFWNQHRVFLIAIVMGEFTILILRTYGFKVCIISFGFY